MDSPAACVISCAKPTADDSSHSAASTLHPHHRNPQCHILPIIYVSLRRLISVEIAHSSNVGIGPNYILHSCLGPPDSPPQTAWRLVERMPICTYHQTRHALMSLCNTPNLLTAKNQYIAAVDKETCPLLSMTMTIIRAADSTQTQNHCQIFAYLS